MQGVISAVDTDRVLGPDELRQVALELLQLIAVDQIPSRHDGEIGGIELGLDLLVKLARIDKSNAANLVGLDWHYTSLAPSRRIRVAAQNRTLCSRSG